VPAEQPTLSVRARDESGSGPAHRIRKEGDIPGVCYGSDVDSTAITLDPDDLRDVLDSPHGRNTIFRVEIDGEDDEHDHVLVKDFQFDPVKRELTHVDLMVVTPDRSIVVDVPIEPQGEAEGVHMGGRLQLVHPDVPVRCTPATIPETITVDVTDLGPNDVISVSDLDYPEGVEPETESDYAVVRVMMPRTGVIGLEPEGPGEEEPEEGEELEEGEEPAEGEEPEEGEEEESEAGDGPQDFSAPGA